MEEGKSALMMGRCPRINGQIREDCTFFGDDKFLIYVPHDVIKFNIGKLIKNMLLRG